MRIQAYINCRWQDR